ncbi:cytochrome P450 [Actinocorallia sp. A-T 12471]|uniref:cytochrome P450 n=1 Tax=Actinocorallia sp. A-T 12471 TaxID=3089813 RepID=UPI0029CB0F9B|nr:cytochrome P450 [Actinocorallia sp. A-T 12471]MDX6742794.1 cytochrome P450 [Actinocorallia sp. A-T 12471]
MTAEEPIRLYGTHIAADPTDLYEEIRRSYGPVAPILLDDDVPAWFVIGYREAHHITSNPQLFARDSRRWNQWEHIDEGWPLMPYVGWTPSVMFAEGPEHQRRAGAIGDALDIFDRTEVAAICERAADLLIDEFSGDGSADLIEQFASQITLHVIAKLFGLPDKDIPILVQDVAESLDVDEKAALAHGRIQERMRRLVEDKRVIPGPDVPSRLLEHEAALTDDEIVIDLLVVMAAAQAPVGNWIGNALRLMLIDDQFSVSLQGGRSSVSHALNEVLWKDTPTQNFIGRWAVHDCELGGRRIKRGDLLVMGYAAANRDPQVSPSYHHTGTNRAHMSFGHGEHGCPYPGPELGEVIAKTAIEVLLDRLPDVELAVDAKELQWRPSLWMRGLFTLPVTFTPTARVDF